MYSGSELTMGHTMARVKLYNPYDLSKHAELNLLVDTESTYTWVGREVLEKLEVRPTARWRFRAIDGRIVERDIGEAVIECLGEKATRIVVFAERNDTEVLGVDALEGLRLEVDPTTRQLKKIEALLAL